MGRISNAVAPELEEDVSKATKDVVDSAPEPDVPDPAPNVDPPDTDDAAETGVDAMAQMAETVETLKDTVSGLVANYTKNSDEGGTTDTLDEGPAGVAEDIVEDAEDTVEGVPWTHRLGRRK